MFPALSISTLARIQAPLSGINTDLIFASGGIALIIAGAIITACALRWARHWPKRRRIRVAVASSAAAILGVAIGVTPYLKEQEWWNLPQAIVRSALPVVGSSAVAFGAATIGWSLLADRSRGRRRCPRCWYPMQGVAGPLCPECGHTAPDERGLFRTRRRWRHAWAGAACAGLGIVIATLPFLASSGPRVLPTPLLLMWMELRGWPRPRTVWPRDTAGELIMRASDPAIPAWERRLAYRRMARHWALDYRKNWPSGAEVYVKPSQVLWYQQRGGPSRLEMRLLNAQGGPRPWIDLRNQFRVILGDDVPEWSDGMLPLGKLPEGSGAMSVEFRMVQVGPQAGSGEPLWSDVVSLPITVAGRIEDCLTPVQDNDLDAEIRSGFMWDILQGRGIVARPGLKLGPIARKRAVTLALRLEFYSSGTLIATSRVWDQANGPGDLSLAAQPLHTLSTTWAQGPSWPGRSLDDADEVRIVPDPEMALHNPAAQTYWQGKIIIKRWVGAPSGRYQIRE